MNSLKQPLAPVNPERNLSAWLRGYVAGRQDGTATHDELQELRVKLAQAEGMNILCTGCGRRFYSASDVASLNPEIRNCECGAPLVGVNRG